MLRRIGTNGVPGLVVVSIGKVVHIFLVGALGIETAALTEFGNKIGGAGGGNCTAVLQCVGLIHYLVSFFVLSLKYVFWSSVRKGKFAKAVPVAILVC